MPPLDWLILPILGGFVFVSNLNYTRYNALRREGHRLVLYSAIAGLAFFFLASMIVRAASPTPFGQEVARIWLALGLADQSGREVVGFLLGAVLWIPLNALGQLPAFAWLSDGSAVDAAIAWKRDPMELALRRAMGAGQTISVTLRSGKVYIGKLTTNVNPAFRMESLHLFLNRSGYRDPRTKRLRIDVDYDESHKEIRAQVEKTLQEALAAVAEEYPDADEVELLRLADRRLPAYGSIEHYEVVVPASEVVSISVFDTALYDKHFRHETSCF